ncbi:MAG: lipid-A-disaccharide synthase [Bacteroidales bacterium]|nr:lipid-A-disaccharide synthase [Bacteroidales bacterium]
MKYFLIAGEASGDLHGSNLMKGILKSDPGAVFRFYGGEKMKVAGGTMARHYKELALMGIWEVFKSLKKFHGFIEECKEDIRKFAPDVLILIDYAGFNLRIAKFGKQNSIPVFYYISPKLWAWGKSRANRIRKYVDRLFVILPFEVAFYKKLRIEAAYYGNPVVDVIEEFKANYHETQEAFRARHQIGEKPVIALLAGSRKQEIDLCLPLMVNASKAFPGYCFVLAGASSIPKDYYNQFLEGTGIHLVYDETYPLLKHAFAAVVTSGTATLETALMNVPEVVIYKTSNASFYLGQFFIMLGVIHVKFFCLVNIILDRMHVKEFLQFNLTTKIKKELKRIVEDGAYRNNILTGYEEMKNLLEKPVVSERVAKKMVEHLASGKKS